MSNFFRDTEVRKAAKDHRCTYCGETIPKGELYKEQSGVWDGRAFRNKFHAECFDALCEEGEGEFMPYSNERPGADTRAAAAIGGQNMTERERDLTTALQGLLREFPSRFDLQEAGWDASDIDKAMNAKTAADAALKSRYCQEQECCYYGHKSPATCDCAKNRGQA